MKSCPVVNTAPERSVNHIAMTKPIVPQTRIGGNFWMKFMPCCSSTR